ncbi:MAG: hypothetical protein KAJ28_00970 [Flavobacteriaceae bacterium]|nr:hypothetical protein [Flavobacteriaceae bacterium]
MTVIEKKKIIKKMIDKLSEDNLDDALFIVQKLASKDKNRKKILLELLKNEKVLFEKLAQ